jgi:anti-anti-sigma factor
MGESPAGLERLIAGFNAGNASARLEAALGPLSLTFRVSGSIEYDNATLFLNCLEACISLTPPGGRVDLDLTDLRYISSTGVGALASVFGTAIKLGFEYRTLNPSEGVLRVIETLGLLSLFRIGKADAQADK